MTYNYYDPRPPLWVGVILVLILLAALGNRLSGGCDAGDDGRKALEKAGYANIKLTGYKWFSCGHGDSYNSGFTANRPGDRQAVSGVVCCGVLKQCTIRY